MRLVSTIIKTKHRLGFLLLLGSFTANAQENSPYSRYGIGDIFPGQHIINRGLGGITAAYRDPLGQSVNFSNPASYSSIALVTYDIGITIDNRKLRSADPIKKFNSTNFSPSYVVLGLPINKKRNIGVAFGLRPMSKINYSIIDNRRLEGIDSVSSLYEGNGGLYQGFMGIGKRWGGLSLGINGAYNFGRKETSTRVIFHNDTVNYQYSNYSTITTYNKLAVEAGMQYQFKTSKNSQVRLGVAAKLKQSLNASQDKTRETFFYDATGATVAIDTALSKTAFEGKIVIPATYTAGIAFETQTAEKLTRTLISVEYESTKWSDYRFFGQPDKLVDNWHLRFGAQLSPDYLHAQSFWSRVTYRTGFFYGEDYINADGNGLKSVGLTLGLGFPVLKRSNYTNQYSNIHTAFEFGKRGGKVNNITENFFRFSVGFSLSDIWFIKRKYD